MRRVSYAGGSFVTSDAVAAAVLRYAAELGNHDRAASIMVPCVTSDGPTTVEVLIGPASQLMTEVVDDYPRDVDGSAFIADIEERIQQQRHRWVTPEDMGSADWDL